MNIANWLHRQAQIAPDRPALCSGKVVVDDYRSFHNKAASVAGWLLDQGVTPGDRVAIFMRNCPEYLILKYAIWYAGAVAVPVNAKLHGREASFILSDAGAALCFASPDLVGTLPSCDARCETIGVTEAAFSVMVSHASVKAIATRVPDDLAWLFYTSGTTGQPKGVMITHRMLVAVSLAYIADVDRIGDDDSVIYAAPMSHGAGLYSMIHVKMGARHVCPDSAGFDGMEMLELARFYGNVQMFAAPTMIRRLTDAAKSVGLNGDGFRSIVYGGGPMYTADIIEAVDWFGPVFVQIYGQGECPMGITALCRHDVADRTHPRWRERLTSVGRAQSPVEISIGDAAGQPVEDGEMGEIMVRGDVVMPGYWRNPHATAQTIRDGWMLTGDVGFIDQDGYLTMQDRSKDVIITGGTNVYPREVEEILLTHSDVTEVSVIGRADPDWGEVVIACYVGTADPVDLDRLCLDNIARFKRPKDYVQLPQLPKNNYGKVLKTDLRRLLKDGEPSENKV